MPDPVLLLRLTGPMQSWGVRSRWDVRDTCLEPTKSAIIGMIGCAMGVRRTSEELDQLDRTLTFGVRIDRRGVVSVDFHTVTGYHRTAAGEFKRSGGTSAKLSAAMAFKPATIVSPREYLHDAAFLAALSGPEAVLARIEAHLRHPRWPVYLGRKSCIPTSPVVHRFAREYSSVEDALRREPWLVSTAAEQESGTAHVVSPPLMMWIEDVHGDVERQDAYRVNALRTYDFRRCRLMRVSVPRAEGRT